MLVVSSCRASWCCVQSCCAGCAERVHVGADEQRRLASGVPCPCAALGRLGVVYTRVAECRAHSALCNGWVAGQWSQQGAAGRELVKAKTWQGKRCAQHQHSAQHVGQHARVTKSPPVRAAQSNGGVHVSGMVARCERKRVHGSSVECARKRRGSRKCSCRGKNAPPGLPPCQPLVLPVLCQASRCRERAAARRRSSPVQPSARRRRHRQQQAGGTPRVSATAAIVISPPASRVWVVEAHLLKHQVPHVLLRQLRLLKVKLERR